MNRQERRRAARAARKQSAGIAAASPNLQLAFQAAVGAYQAGDLEGAEAALQQIDATAADIVEVCHLLGLIALQTGRPQEAVALLARAIKGNPRQEEPYNILGSAYEALGEPDAAIDAYERAIARNRRFVDAHYNLANVLRLTGRAEDAVAHYRKALDLEPGFADAHYNLGLALSDLERYGDAIEQYEAALSAAPDQADAHIGLAKSLIMLHRFSEGEAHAREAIRIDPQAMEAHNNLARAQQSLGRPGDAIASMRQAIAFAPDNAVLYANVGNILEDGEDLAAAEEAYRKAVALDPEFAEVHTNLGMMLLLNRRVEEGWPEYDWRWRREDHEARPFAQPRWNGEALAGKTILVWGDEGAGDEILFASLLPEVIAAAGRCIIECDRRLVPLFARTLHRAEIVPRSTPPHVSATDPSIDLQTPFSELPRWLRPNLFEAPKPAEPYLQADAKLTDACRNRYKARGGALIVGIAWASGNLLRPERNAPLVLWDPILTQPGLTFVSLQYGDHDAEMAETRDRTGVDIFADQEIDQFASLDDFGAQVAAVDLVISITNTTVHIAGALGKEVWTMLPYRPDWRYQREREDTPWYPHMRLFRQSRARVWDDVIDRVAGALKTRSA
ncbi:MAG: tetratricopeptide repeat protein [Alphaproteobacteria bacterium]|nr:tetratricopeptide repeat protein [Alphaproteobacteria bacterium]